MHLEKFSKTLLLTYLILLISFAGGCGGGGDQLEKQQDGNSGGTKEQGSEVNKDAPQDKIAFGTVRTVDSEARSIRMRPTTEEQSEQPVRFKIAENAKITLGEEKAELADVKKGQQARITYFVRKKTGVAREVVLFSGGGASSEGGEQTG
ncbi:MAG TPA: hypothetical protein VK357_05615 [Rubrobacteraceae bacterium]|nr:hypothetical protein [Rubrobacteraceae bacterium]